MGENKIKRIALLTGGGDCPGLNAVIKAVTTTAITKYGYEVIGYVFGYRGLYENNYVELTLDKVAGIGHIGGTILYSSNKDNLFDYLVEENGQMVKKDVSDIGVQNLKDAGVDALVVIGGDGTLTSARDFARKGVNVIGVPKTIDNDLAATDITFGFVTASTIATDFLDRLHTTAQSHHRVLLCEMMGRDAGWITLYSGLAGAADVVLIPEIPFSVESIAKKIKQNDAEGKPYTIIAVAEGARFKDGTAVIGKIVDDSPDPVRYSGIAAKLAEDLEKIVPNHEVRSVQPGHIMRGGNIEPYDRVLSIRYGVAAADLVAKGEFGNMVCLEGNDISHVSLEKVIGANKYVKPETDQIVAAARAMGISFGDE